MAPHLSLGRRDPASIQALYFVTDAFLPSHSHSQSPLPFPRPALPGGVSSPLRS